MTLQALTLSIRRVDDIDALRVHLATQGELHQVMADDGQLPRWQAVLPKAEGPQTHRFDSFAPGVPQEGLKAFFFATRENLFEFDGEIFRETLPQVPPRIFFGVRACDISALAVQDTFFADDPYYRARRDGALIVGVDCIAPCANGFCHVLDAGPFVRDKSVDLILHPQGAYWLLFVVTEKGLASVAALNLPIADAHDNARSDESEAQVIAQFPARDYLLPGMQRINANTVDATLWESLAVQCLSCSGCVSLCPTCSCYATRDVNEPDDSFVRERFWDSCLYEGFQREASGHNPGEAAGARLQRYWSHKFSQQFVAQLGRVGCVGCGRCDAVCPGVIGANDVLRRIAHA